MAEGSAQTDILKQIEHTEFRRLMVIKTDLTLFLFEFLPVYIGKYNKIDFLDNKCSA